MTSLVDRLGDEVRLLARNSSLFLMQKEFESKPAYQLGFQHGLKEGVENNPFDDDIDRHLYRIGYDAGVSEYCRIEHPED
jgi:hypothetical protein